MKTVILAGGFGTRLSEETVIKPKPMVEIGDRPILWHIMKIYSHFDYRDFIIALGYKGGVIKEYFLDYHALQSNLSIDLATGERTYYDSHPEEWKVTLWDTGLNTRTGGRVKRLKPLLDRTFMMTYGDGVADVNIAELVAFHRGHGRIATVTAVRPPARYGTIELDGDTVSKFSEKDPSRESWANGGFFVLEPEVLEWIDDDLTEWEEGVLEKLAAADQLRAFRHQGFWQSMDTVRDRNLLGELWTSGKAPWKAWK